MLFSSMTFICLFLPVVCGLYFIVKPEFRNTVLLAASILFYAWGEPRFLAVMLLTIIVNYLAAIFIECGSRKKGALVCSLLINLGILAYFKYFNFIIDNLNELFHAHISALNIVLPLGISFYTFQAMSYVFDVYRGECSVQKDIYKLALYITLFPQLIAGPIVKYHDIVRALDDRNIDINDIAIGVKRFICGLAKKVLIANTMGQVVEQIFSQSPDMLSPAAAWLGAACYSFQLYFDFSGYSDMAIGLGMIFGFKFMENFNYPYISKSVSEFWRRWHISLSTWFRQYVYIPLGGSRSGLRRTCFNLGIVFLLTGIWHGAAWTFAAWGLWNGFFIIFEKITGLDKAPKMFVLNVFKHVYTIIVFMLGWVIFRSDSLHYAAGYISDMFGFSGSGAAGVPLYYGYIDNVQLITFICALLCSTPIFSKMIFVENKTAKALVNVWLIFLLFFSVQSIAVSSFNPFIYFRF